MAASGGDTLQKSVVLIVDDDKDFLRGLSRSISRHSDAEVLCAGSASQALTLLKEHPVDLLLADVRMPEMDGIRLLERVKSIDPWITVVMMSGYGTIDIAVEAIKKGAYEFVQKPFKPDDIQRVLNKALERNRLIRENIRLKDQLNRTERGSAFVGVSPVLRRVLAQISTVASLNVTVLIRGESGTGKDLAARRIHVLSPRAGRPLVTVNCPAIPETLLESELFGYQKGAFTGAESAKKGLLELASGSSLFLDEIADISNAMQTKLLRVIQEKEIKPLGNPQPQALDVRIIASTNQDLESRIADKSFREDLFYRLNVVTIHMPPLREMIEDIPLLVSHFMGQAVREFGVAPKSISSGAMKYLMRQAWPGNVRQLENMVKKAMIFCRREAMEADDFVAPAHALDEGPGAVDPPQSLPFREARDRLVAEFTVQYVRRALEISRGNISAAARASGLERQHFQQLMKKHAVDAGEFRKGCK